MGTRTISISDDAYERLSRLKGPSNMSFSEVILKYTPPKKKLSEILKEFGPNPALADSVEEASREMRKASMREVDFDADA
ncbi:MULTISPECIES: antitoxin VapB family protein [Methanoculleus]|jgi:predicted CopG family antitoxin|nr:MULTISPECIES: antitoxin VapB family protein [Methanoculleus]MCK9317030.1 antitoxin VapB family protein [Methanoculleus sp.]MDD2252905.1 antitoxin VapB family protein [Methanoculleus sp.]MDD2787621.1 antitoxin VapB family protein [Methanoculleus sp.]MDD3215678.1 antitoxin VapB family protein [Methanoculleus sp.]MDD4313563.1 antitoxin VapB family protein [Methanoculleus sp.]